MKEASQLRDRAITERNQAREDLKNSRKANEGLQGRLDEALSTITGLQKSLAETEARLTAQTEALGKSRVAQAAMAVEVARVREAVREAEAKAEASDRERRLVVRERERMEVAEEKVGVLKKELEAERAGRLRALSERHTALERLAALENVKRDLDELHHKHSIECAKVNALTRTLAARDAGVVPGAPAAAVPGAPAAAEAAPGPLNLVEAEASMLVQAPQGSPLSHLQRPSEDDDDQTSEAALARLKKMGKHWKRNSSFSPANTQVEKVRESPRKPSKSDQDTPTNSNGERRAFR